MLIQTGCHNGKTFVHKTLALLVVIGYNEYAKLLNILHTEERLP